MRDKSPRPAGRHAMDPFFRPSSVVIVGATDTAGSLGRIILHNLLSSSFGGPVFLVNPHLSNVLGVTAYPSVADVPEVPDLAVVATPPPTCPTRSPSAAREALARPSSSRPGSARQGSRAPSSSSACSMRPGATRCGSSGPTAWA